MNWISKSYLGTIHQNNVESLTSTSHLKTKNMVKFIPKAFKERSGHRKQQTDHGHEVHPDNQIDNLRQGIRTRRPNNKYIES